MNALILNSAHSKYPLGKDSWIQATAKAVGEIACSTDTIICSHDPMPWSLVTCLAGRHGMNISLIIPVPAGCDKQAHLDTILDDFNLDGSKVHPVYLDESGIFIDKKNLNKKILKYTRKTLWQLRDRAAVESAQRIYPVSIRPDGRLSRLLQDETVRSKLFNDFRIPWSSEGYIPRYDLTWKTINRLPEGEWLVHWTRASQGPWPGEKAWRFYHDMLENPGEYVRGAGATLTRIVSEQRLRGSSWKLPEGERAVAFTALPIDKALQLMRWRQRFVRYTFEPYGLALRRPALLDLGARRVSYAPAVSGISDRDRLFRHAAGEKTDWTREKEWRIRGDLSLRTIDSRDMLVLVPDEKTGEVFRYSLQRIARDITPKIARDIPVHVIFGEP